MELDLTTNPSQSIIESCYGIHNTSFFRHRKDKYTRWGMTFTENGLYHTEGCYTNILNTTTQPADVGLDVYEFPNKEFYGTMYVKPYPYLTPRVPTYTTEYMDWRIKTFQESRVVTWAEIMKMLLDGVEKNVQSRV